MDSKRVSQPPADDQICMPLPCCGRGLELLPLNEVPLFRCLKRQAKEHGQFIVSPAPSSHPSEPIEKMPAGTLPTPKPRSRKVPMAISKHLPSSEEWFKGPHVEELMPAASAPPRKPGIASYETQMTERVQMVEQTGARPRTTPRKSRNRAAQLPLYPCQPAQPLDTGNGPGIHTAQEQLKAARIPKKDVFDYTRPDLLSWANTLQKEQHCEPASDAEDDDTCVLRQMMSFETRSICEDFSSQSGESSGEEPAKLPLEGGIAEGLANLKLKKASEALTGSPAKRGPMETPLEGTSQALKPSLPQKVVSNIDSVTGDNEEAEEDNSEEEVPFYDLD
uniref:Uncharacterized protein n=1 Tax=Rhipicephalus zambeziensis TaxID=60191 RepID=A0A224YAQ9_9ACAR